MSAITTASGVHDIGIQGDTEVAISANGRYVAFTTSTPGAIPGISDPNGNYNTVVLRDLGTATIPPSTVLVSHDAANDGQISGQSEDISISSDGRYVSFVSNDPGLTGVSTGTYQVFRWDGTTGQVTLVSQNGTGGAGNYDSGIQDRPAMTPDGRYIAFTSYATNLTGIPNNTYNDENVYLRDMETNTTTLVSVNAAGTSTGDFASANPVISADGGEVAFDSTATDLTTDENPSRHNNVFVRNLATSTTTLASQSAAGGSSANGDVVGTPILSPDGNYVAFLSDATNLVPGFVTGNGGQYDLYIRDLQQNTTKLVTVNLSGTAGANANEYNDHVQFSGDSSTLFFDSPALDLIAGDTSGSRGGPYGYQPAVQVYAVPAAGFSSISGQVFNDQNGNGAPDSGEPGLRYWTVFLDLHGTGQITPDDPYVVTDSTGHYAFTGLSPGTYTVAVVPQAGYQQTTPASTYTVTFTADGTAITGKDFGEEYPLPGLTTSAVSFTPSSGAPGQAVTVTWNVTNQGNSAAAGSWEDAVYLSPTPTLGAGAEFLTAVPHNGGLATGHPYTGTATVELPPLPGAWYVIVQADWRNQVFEGAFGANQAAKVAASTSTLTIAVPQLTVGVPTSGQLTQSGPDRYYDADGPRRPVARPDARQRRHQRAGRAVRAAWQPADDLRLRFRGPHVRPAQPGADGPDGTARRLLRSGPRCFRGRAHERLHADGHRARPGDPVAGPVQRRQRWPGHHPDPRHRPDAEHAGKPRLGRDGTIAGVHRLPGSLAPLRHFQPVRPADRYLQPERREWDPIGDPSWGLHRETGPGA